LVIFVSSPILCIRGSACAIIRYINLLLTVTLTLGPKALCFRVVRPSVCVRACGALPLVLRPARCRLLVVRVNSDQFLITFAKFWSTSSSVIFAVTHRLHVRAIASNESS